MRHLFGRAVGVAVLIGTGGAVSHAQRVSSPAALWPRASVVAATSVGCEACASTSMSANTSGAARAAAAPWWAPVASALVPGAGQFVMGQQRSVAYLVAEAYLVVQAMSARRDGQRDRDEYRSLASDVARRPFSAMRPIGAWNYYELMERFLESGVFDRIPGGGVDPETDQNTYNGASWRLARETFWPDPDTAPAASSSEYQRALAFYTARAVRDEYRWSWRDAQLQKDVYEQTIKSANRSYQRAVNMVGLVGANHLASAIDAYVTVRVRRFGGVRVAGMQLDGVRSAVQSVGDPADGRRQLLTAVRFIPAPR